MKEYLSSLLLQSLPLQKLGSQCSPSFSRINKSGNSKKKDENANAKHAASKHKRNIWTIFINSQLPDSPIRGVGASPRIVVSGKSIFDYEYLREFEAKIGHGSKDFVRNLCRTDLCKKIEKTGSLPCPFKNSLSSMNCPPPVKSACWPFFKIELHLLIAL